MTLTIFLLAYAIGPLFLSPLSEVVGRRWVRKLSARKYHQLLINALQVLHISNIAFLIFNLACAFAPNVGAMIGFRFLAGLGGSAPIGEECQSHFPTLGQLAETGIAIYQAIGAGVIGDLFSERDRG